MTTDRLLKTYTADEFTAWCDRHGWSAARLAARIGCHVRTVEKWRSGKRAISPAVMRAIAWALSTTPRSERA